jgi:peptidase M28-like protein
MRYLRRSSLFIGFVLAVALAALLTQRPSEPAGAADQADKSPRLDRKIPPMLKEISSRNIERSIRKQVSFGTRHTLSSQTDPERGIGAARDWIYQEFQRYAADSGGRMTVELQSFVQPATPPRIPAPTTITNVVATLRGTQPESADRVYVVSGHYDSRCTDPNDAVCDAPGANDDASGVAAVLEAARVMSKRKFDATIVFMAVAGEEQGLFGSAHFAEQAKQDGVDVAGMFTNDIVGSSVSDHGTRDPFSVRLFAEGVPTSETPQQAAVRRSTGGENDGPSRQLGRYIKEYGENKSTKMEVRLIWRRDRFLRGGDQIPFLERGYSAVRFTEPNENFAHQHQDVRVEDGVQFGDLIEFVDFDYTARVTRVNVAALGSLALAPAQPKGARVLTSQLTNDTDLVWQANTEPDLAGYEVVWRETTEPLWTHSVRVGNVTSYTARRMSKDNLQFGVRAVDRDGNKSPVSFPLP